MTHTPEPITLDMEFADEGGEGADAVRGAAARRDGRRQHPLHAAGRRRGDVAGHAAAARHAAAGAPVRAGLAGGREAAERAGRRPRPLARAVGRRHERDQPADVRGREPQSAAAPSPFPPIADYAFLSNCHTGALVAPDGSIDWLCVPRFDSPSVFGSLLDREAGCFRFGAVRDQPSRRRASYEPGTNVLITTWKTPTGWVDRARRADHGPARPRGRRSRRTPGRRPTTTPTTCWCAPSSASTAASRSSSSASPSSTTAATPAEWTLVGGDRHTADATGAGQTIRLRTDLALGVEGDRVRARHVLRARASKPTARSPGRRGSRRPADVEEAEAQARRDHALLARLAGPGADARPPLARPDPALRAGDQGPDLHADRRDGGRAHHVAAGDARAASATGTTATPGCATRPSRCRRCTS